MPSTTMISGQTWASTRDTFRPGTMDNHQRSLTWKCYRNALFVRDKLYRHVSIIHGPNLIDMQTVLYALVQCPTIAGLSAYITRLLSRMELVGLSTASIINIVSSPSFTRERDIFITLTAMVDKSEKVRGKHFYLW